MIRGIKRSRKWITEVWDRINEIRYNHAELMLPEGVRPKDWATRWLEIYGHEQAVNDLIEMQHAANYRDRALAHLVREDFRDEAKLVVKTIDELTRFDSLPRCFPAPANISHAQYGVLARALKRLTAYLTNNPARNEMQTGPYCTVWRTPKRCYRDRSQAKMGSLRKSDEAETLRIFHCHACGEYHLGRNWNIHENADSESWDTW